MEVRTTPAGSPLRLARRHRNWTLDRVVSEIDAYLGGSGVTASLVSAWERGTRRTSPRYRAALCAIYGQPPEVLFAHQDKGRPTLTLVDADQGLINPADVICGFEQLQAAMISRDPPCPFSAAGISWLPGRGSGRDGAWEATSRRDHRTWALDRASMAHRPPSMQAAAGPGGAGCGDDHGGGWSGRERHAAQPVQRQQELVRPWPAGGQVQVPAPC